MKYEMGFVGMGNMATAIAGGIIKKGVFTPESMIASRRSRTSLDALKEMHGIAVTTDNVEVVRSSNIILLGTKPQFLEEVIDQIRHEITLDQVIISITPGKTIEWFHNQFGKQIKIIRCMPNCAAFALEGCTSYCCSDNVSEIELLNFEELFSSVGKVYQLEEKYLDAVVGVSGSAPAFIFMLIEAMADGAVAAGIPRDIAYSMVAQTVYGSAKMVMETGEHPGVLKDMVCTPGGTTIEGVYTLERLGFRSAMMEAMRDTVEKSKRM
ncbi:MAG: pyrroline-5-carboxylate reductase [Eubacteriales bacterium]